MVFHNLTFSKDYETVIKFHSYPPLISLPHNSITFQKNKKNNIDTVECFFIHSVNQGLNYDTFSREIKVYDALNKIYKREIFFLKDQTTNIFFPFNEDLIRQQLTDSLKMKHKKIKGNTLLKIANNVNEILLTKYKWESLGQDDDSIISIKEDEFGNNLSVLGYNYHYKDIFKIIYEYNYKENSGRSYEFFQGKKYLMSTVLLNNNLIVKEDYYMLDYILCDYECINSSVPIQSLFYKYNKISMPQEITLIMNKQKLFFLFNYR